MCECSEQVQNFDSLQLRVTLVKVKCKEYLLMRIIGQWNSLKKVKILEPAITKI